MQSEAFPADLAREVVAKNIEAIRAANDLTEREGLLQSGLTAGNQRLLETKEMFPEPFRKRYANEFSQLQEAATLFSVWCAESQAFAESDGKFVETLNFAYDADWDLAIGRLRDEYFQPAVGIDSDASLFEGYLRSLDHLNRIVDLMTVEGTRPAGWPARATMRVEVANIHSWRLNFQNDRFVTRFDKVTEVVESRLRREALADKVHLQPGGFVDGVGNLVHRHRQSLGYLSMGLGR